MNTTIATTRGCGTRDAGSVYLCLGIGPGGTLTVEDLILDPVKIWPGGWQRGFKIIPNRGGWNDVGIFVGEEFYKSLYDFVEEARRYGISRKVPPTFPFEQLTPGLSRMIFIHSKAHPRFDFALEIEAPLPHCKVFPTIAGPDFYLDNRDMWNETVPGYHPKIEKQTVCTFAHQHLAGLIHDASYGDDLGFEIQMPSFSYKGVMPILVKPADWDLKLTWDIGAFMSAPLSHVEMPKKLNKSAAQRANKSGFETIVTDW